MAVPTILVVEDDLNDEELGRIALEENNIKCELVVTHDGREAMDFIYARGKFAGRDASQLPQVVLLDLKLPKFNGLELLRELRSQEATKFLPIVIFTSSKEEKDLAESYRLGANAYVPKPVEFAEFSATVQQIATFWVLMNRAYVGR